MEINCNPIGFILIFSSRFVIERRDLGKGHSAFSDWNSNGPSSLDNRVSPGGP